MLPKLTLALTLFNCVRIASLLVQALTSRQIAGPQTYMYTFESVSESIKFKLTHRLWNLWELKVSVFTALRIVGEPKHLMYRWNKNSRQKVHPNFAQSSGRDVLGKTTSLAPKNTPAHHCPFLSIDNHRVPELSLMCLWRTGDGAFGCGTIIANGGEELQAKGA